MRYLLIWRMAHVNDLLSWDRRGVAQEAECIDDTYASSFSVASTIPLMRQERLLRGQKKSLVF